VFPWAPFRSTQAAIKLHTLLDLRGNIPSFIFISDGKLHDVNILDQLVPEPGAIYVMDRVYIDFDRFSRFHEAGSFFVIRPKSNLKAAGVPRGYTQTCVPPAQQWLRPRSCRDRQRHTRDEWRKGDASGRKIYLMRHLALSQRFTYLILSYIITANKSLSLYRLKPQ
jgi:hypothetical protein